MHPLILRLVHQRLDPAAIVTHAAQAFEVIKRRADHSRHRGNRLQHDRTMPVALREKRVGDPAQALGKAEGNPVGQPARGVVNGEVDIRGNHFELSFPPGYLIHSKCMADSRLRLWEREFGFSS